MRRWSWRFEAMMRPNEMNGIAITHHNKQLCMNVGLPSKYGPFHIIHPAIHPLSPHLYLHITILSLFICLSVCLFVSFHLIIFDD